MFSPLEKITSTLLLNAFPNFTEPQISFHILYEPAHGPCQKPDKSIQQHNYFTRLSNFNIILPFMFWFLKVIFLLGFPIKLSMKPSPLP